MTCPVCLGGHPAKYLLLYVVCAVYTHCVCVLLVRNVKSRPFSRCGHETAHEDMLWETGERLVRDCSWRHAVRDWWKTGERLLLKTCCQRLVKDWWETAHEDMLSETGERLVRDWWETALEDMLWETGERLVRDCSWRHAVRDWWKTPLKDCVSHSAQHNDTLHSHSDEASTWLGDHQWWPSDTSQYTARRAIH